MLENLILFLQQFYWDFKSLVCYMGKLCLLVTLHTYHFNDRFVLPLKAFLACEFVTSEIFLLYCVYRVMCCKLWLFGADSMFCDSIFLYRYAKSGYLVEVLVFILSTTYCYLCSY